MTVTVGSSASQTFTVAEADTAQAVGSGDVPVLATPRMIAWCEAITVQAIADQLSDGETTVGYRIRVDHLAPTIVGATVTVVATVVEVDRMQVTFEVEVAESGATAAKGTITRVVVNRDTFIERAGK
jgi:predicted thioesterase